MQTRQNRRKVVVRVGLLGVLGLLVLVVGAFAYHGRRRANARLDVDILPAFSEPAAGPRAPNTHAFGFAIGGETLAAAETRLRAAGLACVDRSIRALMKGAREEKQREIEAAKARGESVDSVSGASTAYRRSPKEANPQVRLTCDAVPAHALLDRPRPPTQGRLILVWDSKQHPLRHASFERSYATTSMAAALTDYITTRRALVDLFGPPVQNAAEPDALPWLAPVETRWVFADIQVRVTALNYGPRGIVLSEIVEVPWPVRPDAPVRRAVAQR
ncbi:MAG TPA: hypothetical protein VGG33_26335 [Polyangia bacterium]